MPPSAFILLSDREEQLKELLIEVRNWVGIDNGHIRDIVEIGLRMFPPERHPPNRELKDPFTNWRRPMCGDRCSICARNDALNELKYTLAKKKEGTAHGKKKRLR